MLYIDSLTSNFDFTARKNHTSTNQKKEEKLVLGLCISP